MAQTPRRGLPPSMKSLRQQQAVPPEVAPPEVAPPEAAPAPPPTGSEQEDTGLEMLPLADEVLNPAPAEAAPAAPAARSPVKRSRAVKAQAPDPSPVFAPLPDQEAPLQGVATRRDPDGSWLVLGLDPSLTDFGWSLIRFRAGSDPELVQTGRWKTPPSLPEPLRHLYQRERLSCLFRERPDISWVGTETPAFGQSYSEGMYALFVQVQQAVWQARKRFLLLAVPTVKALGSLHLPGYTGDMGKPEMVRAAMSLLGSSSPEKLNHNIADSVVVAWGTWRFARLAELDIGPKDLTAKEHKSFVGGSTQKTAGILSKEGERWFNLPDPSYDAFYHLPPGLRIQEPKLILPLTYS